MVLPATVLGEHEHGDRLAGYSGFAEKEQSSAGGWSSKSGSPEGPLW